MGYHVGVDLGTTFTAAALVEHDRVEVVQLGDHAPQVPSAVFRASTEKLLVGEAAVRSGATDPGRLAAEFKRRMGDDVSIMLGGAPMPPHLLMATVLRWVVTTVTQAQDEPPETVMLSHPANWGAYRRELMAQAAAEAGVPDALLCTEPEAAAVHFASLHRVGVGGHIAVYDLGGGTFDTAVLRHLTDGSFAIVGTPQGIEHLGGVDFDDALFEFVRDSVDLTAIDPSDPGIVMDVARLRAECISAKEFLSVENETLVPVNVGPVRAVVRVNRADLENIVRPALLNTAQTLARTVAQAGIDSNDLEAVVLVGGSSRIPLVTETIVHELGRPVHLSPHPKLCVALGAALLATTRSSAAAQVIRPTEPATATKAWSRAEVEDADVEVAEDEVLDTQPIPLATAPEQIGASPELPPPSTIDRRRLAILGAIVATALVAGSAGAVALLSPDKPSPSTTSSTTTPPSLPTSTNPRTVTSSTSIHISTSTHTSTSTLTSAQTHSTTPSPRASTATHRPRRTHTTTPTYTATPTPTTPSPTDSTTVLVPNPEPDGPTLSSAPLATATRVR